MSQPKTIRDVEITNRRVLLRVDFNVPLNQSGEVIHDRRIRAAIPTIEHCLQHNSRLVLMSHLGRPGGTVKAEYSHRPLVAALEGLLNGVSVRFVDDFQALSALEAGSDAARSQEDRRADQVILLENLRFHPEEKAGDEAFAQKLAGLGDVYVNDAFATCHRQHASMFAVPQQFGLEDKAVGFLVERELKSLDSLLDDPQSPLVAILGGAKVADKINVVASLLDRVDKFLIGGAMAYTFLSASEHDVGESLVEALRHNPQGTPSLHHARES